MDVHLHGACMGKLVGPAGGGGGTGGGGISTQFRILPNAIPSEAYPVDAEKVPVNSHRAAMHLRLSSSGPHRTFSPEPLKIAEDYLSSGSSSPTPDVPAGFLLHDVPAGFRPSLAYSSTLTLPSRDLKDPGSDIEPQSLEPEILLVSN